MNSIVVQPDRIPDSDSGDLGSKPNGATIRLLREWLLEFHPEIAPELIPIEQLINGSSSSEPG